MRYVIYENVGTKVTRFERGTIAKIVEPVLRVVGVVSANGRVHANNKAHKKWPETKSMKLQITEM